MGCRDQIVPFVRAIADLTDEIVKNPQSAALYARRAQLWTDHGDDDRASGDLDPAIRLEPDQPWLYVRRSSIRLRKSQLDQALRRLRQGDRARSQRRAGLS